MDFDAMEKDVRTVAKSLPPELIGMIGDIIKRFYKPLEIIMPEIMERLMPHFASAMFEMGAGMLNKKELETRLMKIFEEYAPGVTVNA